MSIPKNKRSPSSIKNKALERDRGGQKKVRVETAFDDYRDKMIKLANANDAEAFYLDVLSKDCRSVAAECQTVADSLDKVTDALTDLKDGLIPQESEN